MMMFEVGMVWTFANNILDLFEQLFGFGKGGKGKKIWRICISAIWWSLWLEWNTIIFENYVDPSYKMYDARDRRLW